MYCNYCKKETDHTILNCEKLKLKCDFCGGSAHTKDMCSKRKIEMKCTYCKKSGHIKKNCELLKIRCSKCGGGAHTEDKCLKDKIRCIICNELGHSYQTCVIKKSVCLSCESQDHPTEMCKIKNVCNFCGQSHLTKLCPHDLKNIVCIKCKKLGHSLFLCPESFYTPEI